MPVTVQQSGTITIQPTAPSGATTAQGYDRSFLEQAARGPAGPAGPVGAKFIFDQSAVAIPTWNITHNLGFFPAVTVVDNAGIVVIADVVHVNANQVTINFANVAGSFAGKAYLS